MRTLTAAALAAVLFAAPAFAKSSKSKGPKSGQYCSKSAVGTTTTDSSGNTLECRIGKKGKARWVKK